jgi:N-acetylmuramoyl-L-alanine amidase
MKLKIFLNGTIAVLIVVLLIVVNYGSYEMTLRREFVRPTRVIVLDAGHGGIDGGAVSEQGTVEKYINLEITQKLKGYLDLFGYNCILLREDDNGLYEDKGRIRDKKLQDLKIRKELIDKYNAELFISIHLNKYPEEKYYGSQVFYNKGDALSQKLGELIQQQLVKNLGNDNKRLAKASSDYYLLRGNKMPSVIVECGFLSNLNEEKMLKDDTYQNKIAFSIFKAINSYYDEVFIQ